ADPRQAWRGEDRRDDERGVEHARRHRRAWRDQGLHRGGKRSRPGDRDVPDPGLLGRRGLQDPREVRRGLLRPQRVDVRGRGTRREEHGRGVTILISKDTRFIVQGITGREAVNLTRENLDYGAVIVGGVTPGRAGRDVHGVPVYDSVRDVVKKHGAVEGSIISVPPGFALDAAFEAIENGIELIVIVTENIPRKEVAQMVELAALRGARIIGPNCLGIIVPDVIKMGGIGGPAKDAAKSYTPRPVRVINRRGGAPAPPS